MLNIYRIITILKQTKTNNIMKKLIFTLLILPLFLTTNAQGDPSRGEDSPAINDGFMRVGRMYAGGTIAFTGTSEKHEDSNGEENGPKQSNFTFLPEVGYVFSDKLAADLAIGYASSTSTRYQFNSSTGDDWELKNKSGLFIINPMLKAYKKLSNRLYCMPSLGLSVGFGSGADEFVGFNEDTFEEEVQSEDFSEFAFGASLSAGLKYFPSEKWAVSLSYGSLYYNTSTSTSKDDSNLKWTNNSYGLDLDLSSVRVGAYYFFK